MFITVRTLYFCSDVCRPDVVFMTTEKFDPTRKNGILINMYTSNKYMILKQFVKPVNNSLYICTCIYDDGKIKTVKFSELLLFILVKRYFNK